MRWPQITLISLLGIELLLTAYLHGKERKDKFNFWKKLINAGVFIFILWQGGFF